MKREVPESKGNDHGEQAKGLKALSQRLGLTGISMCQLPLQSEVRRRRDVLILSKERTYDVFHTLFSYCCKQFRRSKMKREGSLTRLLLGQDDCISLCDSGTLH